MGLDIYAGPITRYVAGDWLTIVQQAGMAKGTTVEIVRPKDPEPEGDDNGDDDLITDPVVIEAAIGDWQKGMLAALGVTEGWIDTATGDYATDKPDWDGYGAVVLLAAYDEQPELRPGSSRRGVRRSAVPETAPRDFADAPAFREASAAPKRYPTLLRGTEWCLPLAGGPAIYRTATPNGNEVVMGRVDLLRAELTSLNVATLRLSPGDLAVARHDGPPEPGSAVEAVASFGLAVLLGLAEYAATHRVPWIMDY